VGLRDWRRFPISWICIGSSNGQIAFELDHIRPFSPCLSKWRSRGCRTSNIGDIVFSASRCPSSWGMDPHCPLGNSHLPSLPAKPFLRALLPHFRLPFPTCFPWAIVVPPARFLLRIWGASKTELRLAACAACSPDILPASVCLHCRRCKPRTACNSLQLQAVATCGRAGCAQCKRSASAASGKPATDHSVKGRVGQPLNRTLRRNAPDAYSRVRQISHAAGKSVRNSPSRCTQSGSPSPHRSPRGHSKTCLVPSLLCSGPGAGAGARSMDHSERGQQTAPWMAPQSGGSGFVRRD
jgi:hypothetical protein